MKLLKKSFRILAAAILVMAFALTVTACKKNDTRTWKVTFHSNKGSAVATQYPEDGTKAKRPEDPTREGYVFVDWFDDEFYKNVYDFDTPVTKDIDLYARWQEDDGNTPVVGEKVTITLNLNYENKSESVEINKGATLPLDKQTPERTDWNFAGWYKDSACTQLFNLTEKVSANITLYAKWSKDPVQPADGTGIDFSKEWDGTGNSAGGSDNFVFDKTVSIGSVSGEPVEPDLPATEGQQITVSFNSNGGSTVSAQSVSANEKAIAPVAPEKDGYMFCGWYTDNTFNTAYDFNAPVTNNLNLHAKWAQVDSKIKSVNGYEESLAVVWTDGNPSSATVQYKAAGSNNWKTVEAPLIRKVDGDARVDVVGLSAGEYNVKITTSSGAEINLPEAVKVTAYDRSGYAHFNRKNTEAAYDGVGAYKDDGTLKDGALVIYVNEANKNDITLFRSTFKNTANGLVYEDISAYFGFSVDENGGNKTTEKGIGYLLNNAQYGSADREKVGILALTEKYGAVDVRIIGTVSAEYPGDGYKSSIGGLTQPNTRVGGGSPDDNGRMVRMTNAKNVTVEGVGDDTVIVGWGFHFVSNDNLHKYKNSGTSFEARNMTFDRYPEDALGMEGTQGDKVDATGSITSGASSASAKFISPVERCWIHNNTFYQGYFENPKESDKAEGDGSCDFKRGQYYTLSYNYFENCHKTNLIGSSDTSQTYNVSIHHNWYNAVQSRQPLTRRANVHYYNNYVSDATDYVTSLRANCLVFSEANYYDGCKNVTQKKDGVGIAWKNVYYSCFPKNDYTELTSRTQTVSNECKYLGGNIDYTQFYINPELFYYDSENKVSDCLLDDAIGARIRVMTSAGVHGSGKTDTLMNQYEPSKAVTSGTTVDAKAVSGDGEVNGVLFKNFKSGKGKGQIATFKLTAPMEVTITGASGSGDSIPQLMDSYGKMWIEKFTGDRTVVLPAGTYFIATGQKDKESNIGTISFADTVASSEARIAAAKTTLAAIPEEISTNSYDLIKAAKDAYSALLADERTQIDSDLVARLQKAEKAYESLAIERVIARINYIGTVDENSYNRINAARREYNALNSEQQAKITNLAKLTAAEAEFAKYAAKNVNDKIADLPDLSRATISTAETLERVENWFNAVENAYQALTDEQQKQVTNYNKVTAGLAELKKFENMINFRATLAETEVNTLTIAQGSSLKKMYSNLTEAQKELLTFAENKKYEEIIAKHTELASQTKLLIINNKQPVTEDGDFWTVTGTYKDGVSASINGETYTNGLKLDKSGKVSFTTSSKMILKVYFAKDGKARIKLDGSIDVTGEKEGDHYVATVELEAGSHTITKGKDGENYLYMVELSPVK